MKNIRNIPWIGTVLAWVFLNLVTAQQLNISNNQIHDVLDIESKCRNKTLEKKSLLNKKLEKSLWIDIKNNCQFREELKQFHIFFKFIDPKEYNQIYWIDFLDYIKNTILENAWKFPLSAKVVSIIDKKEITWIFLLNGLFVLYDTTYSSKIVTPVLENKTTKIQDIFPYVDKNWDYKVSFFNIENFPVSIDFRATDFTMEIFSNINRFYDKYIEVLKKWNPNAQNIDLWKYKTIAIKEKLLDLVLEKEYGFSWDTPLNWNSYKSEIKQEKNYYPKTYEQAFSFLNLSEAIVWSDMEFIFWIEEIIFWNLDFQNWELIKLDTNKSKLIHNFLNDIGIFSTQEKNEYESFLLKSQKALENSKDIFDFSRIKIQLLSDIIELFFKHKEKIQDKFHHERDEILNFIQQEISFLEEKSGKNELQIRKLPADLQVIINEIQEDINNLFPKLDNEKTEISEQEFSVLLTELINKTSEYNLINWLEIKEEEYVEKLLSYFNDLWYIVSPVYPYFVHAEKIQEISWWNIDGLRLLIPELKDEKIKIFHHLSKNWVSAWIHIKGQVIIFPNNIWKRIYGSVKWDISEKEFYNFVVWNEFLHYYLDKTYKMPNENFSYDSQETTLKNLRTILDWADYQNVNEFLSDVVSINTSRTFIIEVLKNSLNTVYYDDDSIWYKSYDYTLSNNLMYYLLQFIVKNKKWWDEVIELMKNMRRNISPEFHKSWNNKQQYNDMYDKIISYLIFQLTSKDIEFIQNFYLETWKALLKQLEKKNK